jgi:hypothetical protein
MRRRVGVLFWLEIVLASLSAFIAALTLVWHDWVEGIFDFDPDRFSGSFEWELVAVCVALTVLCGTLARREWRKAAAA